MLAKAIGAGRTELSEIESKQILEAIGIPVATAYLAESAEEAVELAARVGFPAVLKVLSPQAVHKSEVGGVELGLGSPAEVNAAFERIRQSLAAKRPGACFDGVAVQAMAARGLELIAGVTRDDRFGALVIVGLGGVLVEVFKDTALRIAPVSAADARAMLGELRGAALLQGVRGSAPADLDAIAGLVAKISEFAAEHAEVREMDLNPVVAYSKGLRVLDARILLDPGLLDPGAAQSAAAVDPRHARRAENLARAFDARAVAVIGDKRMGGYIWLRAMSRFSRKLYSVQIDPNEIPGIEAMGVTNCKSLAEVPDRSTTPSALCPDKSRPASSRIASPPGSRESASSPRASPRPAKSWA